MLVVVVVVVVDGSPISTAPTGHISLLAPVVVNKDCVPLVYLSTLSTLPGRWPGCWLC